MYKESSLSAQNAGSGLFLCLSQISSIFTVLRAVYMSAVSVRYLLMEDEGFRLNQNVSYIVGIAFALACFSV